MPRTTAALPRRRFLQGAAAWFALPAAGRAAGDEPSWLWSGAITPTSATVVVAFPSRPPVPLPLLVSTARDLANARAVEGRVTAAPSRRRLERTVIEFRIDGLAPATEYFVGFREHSGTRGRFRTFGRGPFSFTAAFASCAGGTRVVPMSHVSNSRVFDAIAAIDPHVFIHMGDLHYYNITGAPRPLAPMTARFRRSLDRVLSQEHQALLYRRTPIVYMWDDHDYGRDNSDAASPTREAARAFYAVDVPHYPLPLAPEADGPIAQVFDIGRVRFLVTDGRSERVPAQRTMLGQKQFAWMLAELERAARDGTALVAWVNPVPWITTDTDPEGWGPFAAERVALGERIRTLGLGSRLVMLSGDAHMLAFDDGRHNPHGGFVVAQAAPLDRFLRRKGGPYSHDPGKQFNGQFATLQVDDTGTALTATLQGYRHDAGRPIAVPETRLRLRCAGGTCALVP